ncbi:hypothetical protein niasHT_032504 [Heterodera trifolii]|uniref:Uncharacterized protein n=2 Tax=Heterodera TaxID=34509 RepID=A0ABD2IPX2_9BILA
MGNDQSSSAMYATNTGIGTNNNHNKRRQSTVAFAETVPVTTTTTMALPEHIDDAVAPGGGTNRDAENDDTRHRRPLSQQQSQQQQQNRGGSARSGGGGRRRSSCVALHAGTGAGAAGDGIFLYQRQMKANSARQEEEKPPPSAHLPLNPARSIESVASRFCAAPQALSGSRQFLAPSSPTTVARSNSSNRNRRMSVAGDQQDSLRKEMARAAGGGIGTSSSTGGTPQRRFSRATTSNCGANSATIALVTRKMSELAAGTAAETTLNEHLKLSSYQLHILQQSWPRIRSTGVFANAFKDLSRKNASAKEMFQKMSIVEGFSSGKCCDQKEHGRQLGELFDFALQNLNAPSRLVQDRCYRMGEQHFTVFGSGNEAQLWDDLGESISQSLAKTESVRGKREAFRAWITLTNFLVESMRVAYTQQFKRRSLHRHSSSSQVVVQLATLEELSPSAQSMMSARHRAHTPTVPLTTL